MQLPIKLIRRSFVTGLIILFASSTLTGCARIKAAKNNNDRANWTVQEFYNEAKVNLNDGDYEDAVKLYKELESYYPFGPLTEQAQVEIAYAHHKDNEPSKALAAAERFIRLHPVHPSVDYAYYLKGLINFTKHESVVKRLIGGNDYSDRDPASATKAFYSFRDLIERFPESRYAEDSRQRMTYLLNALAYHEIQVASYYLSRGAYVAVVNRCKNVIEEYQQTPAVEDALGMMAIAYRHMGLNNLAADSRRVLKTNFPNSGYLDSSVNTLLSKSSRAVKKKKPSMFKRLLKRDKS